MSSSHASQPRPETHPLHGDGPIERLDECTARPVWRRAGIALVERELQARSPQALMDLAGLATARLAMAVAPHAQRIGVFAGPGNNAGDGLEAALHLHQAGYAVELHLLTRPEQLPADAHRAWQRAQHAGVSMAMGLPTASLDRQDLYIDALLGTGARRPPEGELLSAIRCMRASSAPVLAIDLPTGLDADSGQALGTSEDMVLATHTLTMIAAKPGLFMGHGRDACGQLWLAPLLPTPPAHAADAEINPRPSPHPRLHASHKGTHGDVAIVGGEDVRERGMGMRGAARLAASAALHAGAGRTLLAWAQDPITEQGLMPDVMLRSLHALDWPHLTVVLGCGGGHSIAGAMGRALQHSARLVLDADALNALATDAWLQALVRARAKQRQGTVMTPHPLEAARLLGCSTQTVQADRLGAAIELSARFCATVALKGSGTVIAQTGQTPRINATGNGRLAVGGSGDVLAGFIGACWAQNQDPWQATCEAVWRHGELADTWPVGVPLTASALARRWR